MPIQWIEALSLRQKMMALNLFGITATLLVTLALFSLIYFVTARQRLTDSAEATARQLAQNTAAMLAFGDRVATRALLAALDAHSDAVMATVYDQRGAVFATWTHPRALPGDMSAAPAAVSADLGTGTVVRRLSTRQLDVLAPIFVQEERVGVLFLRESLRSINREIRQFALIGLGFTLGSITLAALLLNRLQLRALAPVFELSGLAERVARDYDYRLRARVRTGDEVGRLAECFNEMLERIEARERALNAEIGERRAAERRLDRLAHYDSLPQLPNRHSFEKEIPLIVGDTVANGQLAALMFIDLDDFKRINDTAGHEAGDLLLQVVAKRLSAVLRASDRLYRLGGDEFAAILPQIGNIAQAETLAERLIAAVRKPIAAQGIAMGVGASVGIACCPVHAAEPSVLLRHADIAMYAAKQAGKSAYRLFDPSMTAPSEPSEQLHIGGQTAANRASGNEGHHGNPPR